MGLPRAKTVIKTGKSRGIKCYLFEGSSVTVCPQLSISDQFMDEAMDPIVPAEPVEGTEGAAPVEVEETEEEGTEEVA